MIRYLVCSLEEGVREGRRSRNRPPNGRSTRRRDQPSWSSNSGGITALARSEPKSINRPTVQEGAVPGARGSLHRRRRMRIAMCRGGRVAIAVGWRLVMAIGRRVVVRHRWWRRRIVMMVVWHAVGSCGTIVRGKRRWWQWRTTVASSVDATTSTVGYTATMRSTAASKASTAVGTAPASTAVVIVGRIIPTSAVVAPGRRRWSTPRTLVPAHLHVGPAAKRGAPALASYELLWQAPLHRQRLGCKGRTERHKEALIRMDSAISGADTNEGRTLALESPVLTSLQG
jgi:hypothetical protein